MSCTCGSGEISSLLISIHLCISWWSAHVMQPLITIWRHVMYLIMKCFVLSGESRGYFIYQCLSYLEEKSISYWVAEAEDKVFLGMFRYGLDDAVLHPQSMFRNTVMVNSWTAVGLIQEKCAALRTQKRTMERKGNNHNKYIDCH